MEGAVNSIILPYRIRRKFIQEHTEWTFVYGSDYMGKSFFGCAYEASGEPNAYPVPTIWKICPSSGEKFLCDSEFDFFKVLIDEKIREIPLNKPIVPFPKLGMGHSQLNYIAPRLFAYLKDRLKAIAYPDIKVDYEGLIYPVFTTI